MLLTKEFHSLFPTNFRCVKKNNNPSFYEIRKIELDNVGISV